MANKNYKPGFWDITGAGTIGAVILLVIIVAWLAMSSKTEDKPKEASTAASMPTALTLNDTLSKSEIRAVVFLEMEYGLKKEDIAITAQAWYPAQKMEVCKWRIREGMQHLYVVTQTRLTGNDINSTDAYNTWSVKVVNKFNDKD